MSYGNINYGEFWGRRTLSNELTENPEAVLGVLRREAAHARKKRQHYEGYGYGAAALVYAPDEVAGKRLKVISGANFKLKEGDYINRVCAEVAMIYAMNPEDKFLPIVVIESPPLGELKKQEGENKPTNSGWSCGPCRTFLSSHVSDKLIVATFPGNAADPAEVLSLEQMINYQRKEAAAKYPVGISKEGLYESLGVLLMQEYTLLSPLPKRLPGVAPRELQTTN